MLIREGEVVRPVMVCLFKYLLSFAVVCLGVGCFFTSVCFRTPSTRAVASIRAADSNGVDETPDAEGLGQPAAERQDGDS